MRGWEVEWCHSCQLEPDGPGCLPDTAQFSYRDFAKRADAERFAHEIIRDKKDFFGACRVTEFEWREDEFIPGAWEKEHIGEMEEVST